MFDRCTTYEEYAEELRERIRLMNAEARRCKERLGIAEPEELNKSLEERIERHQRMLRAYRWK